METKSLKALAVRVLQGNIKGNSLETSSKNNGNFNVNSKAKSFYEVSASHCQEMAVYEDEERLSWCFSICMLTPKQSLLCERVKPCPKGNT